MRLYIDEPTDLDILQEFRRELLRATAERAKNLLRDIDASIATELRLDNTTPLLRPALSDLDDCLTATEASERAEEWLARYDYYAAMDGSQSVLATVLFVDTMSAADFRRLAANERANREEVVV